MNLCKAKLSKNLRTVCWSNDILNLPVYIRKEVMIWTYDKFMVFYYAISVFNYFLPRRINIFNISVRIIETAKINAFNYIVCHTAVMAWHQPHGLIVFLLFMAISRSQYIIKHENNISCRANDNRSFEIIVRNLFLA